MTTQTSDTPLEPRWKKVIIVSVSAGAGFAVILAVIVGSVIWYGSRPSHPKAWDVRAIRARYSGATINDIECFQEGMSQAATTACEDTHSDIQLEYALENTTDYDYRMHDQTALEIMERDERVLLPTLLQLGNSPPNADGLNVSISKIHQYHPDINETQIRKDFDAYKAGGPLPDYMRDGVVDRNGKSYWKLETPVFVPPHEAVAVHIGGPYGCPRCSGDKLKSFVKDNIPELILFDTGTRYEIKLPKP